MLALSTDRSVRGDNNFSLAVIEHYRTQLPTLPTHLHVHYFLLIFIYMYTRVHPKLRFVQVCPWPSPIASASQNSRYLDVPNIYLDVPNIYLDVPNIDRNEPSYTCFPIIKPLTARFYSTTCLLLMSSLFMYLCCLPQPLDLCSLSSFLSYARLGIVS